MAETTEEKAFRRTLRGLKLDVPLSMYNRVEAQAEDWVRAAVEAETERAASVNPLEIPCEYCQATKGEHCQADHISHAFGRFCDSRWRAAIRAVHDT